MKRVITLSCIQLTVEEANFIGANRFSSQPLLSLCEHCSDKYFWQPFEPDLIILNENNHLEFSGTCSACGKQSTSINHLSSQDDDIDGPDAESLERVEWIRLLHDLGLPFSSFSGR